jgi:hypothetical protein
MNIRLDVHGVNVVIVPAMTGQTMSGFCHTAERDGASCPRHGAVGIRASTCRAPRIRQHDLSSGELGRGEQGIAPASSKPRALRTGMKSCRSSGAVRLQSSAGLQILAA